MVDWNSYAKNYDTLNQLVAYQELLDQLLETIIDLDLPRNSILDLGCGTGSLSVKLHEKFPKSSITLLDNNEEMIKRASEKLTKESGTIRIESFDIANSSDWNRLETYDLIVLNNVLYTIKDKKELLSRLIDKLAEGGAILISDPVPTSNYQYMEIIKMQFQSLGVFLKSLPSLPHFAKVMSINKKIDNQYERCSKEEYIKMFDELGLNLIKEEPSYVGQANLFVLKHSNV